MVESKKSKETETRHKLEEKLTELRKTDLEPEQSDLSGQGEKEKEKEKEKE
jgi:hypothetical protein